MSFVDIALAPDCNIYNYQVYNRPESLAPLGMMGAQLRVRLKALDAIVQWCSRCFRGFLILIVGIRHLLVHKIAAVIRAWHALNINHTSHAS